MIEEKMPMLFLGHGSPMNAIEENEFTKGFSSIGESIPRPASVLCISAHWETRGTYLTAAKKPPTIHDFGGFPRKLYDVQYNAPGNPELASDVRDMLSENGAMLNQSRGFDHGAWSVLKHLYPEADIPVIQMSLDYTRPVKEHYWLAQELSSFRRKGVLIVGSGNIVHNLGMVAWDRLDDNEYGYDWATEASQKIKELIVDGDHDSLANYHESGNSLKLAIPSPEHFLPLLYVLALREKDEEQVFFNDKLVAGSISMTSLKIG